MPVMMLFATWNGCLIRQRTIATCSDLCFAFYDRMVIFDHITKTIAVIRSCLR